jgi:hypothetical protein
MRFLSLSLDEETEIFFYPFPPMADDDIILS